MNTNEITINAEQLIGTKLNEKSALHAIFANNSKNKIGIVDYNKYGEMGHTMEAISEIFCDNFLLYSIINGDKCKGKFSPETGPLNSNLVKYMKEDGLLKTRVKAITVSDFTPTQEQINTYKRLNPMDVITPNIVFRKQVFKAATAEEDQNIVRAFLSKMDGLNKCNYYLEDVDFTQDFTGSFNKQNLIEHLVKIGFTKSGEYSEVGDKVIVDNNNTVGNNCLTFMVCKDGYNIRYKVYNKFAQSLESASIRSNVGSHLTDWISNPEERLRETIKKSIDYGLTRLEITYYKHVPTNADVCRDIEMLTSYIPPEIAYRTPISNQWKAVCENLKHTLVVYNEKDQTVIFGLFYNELTNRIGGVYLNNCCPKKLTWLLSACSLDKDLPIDVIYVELEKGFKALKSGENSKRETINTIKMYSESYIKTGYNNTHLIKGCSIFHCIPKHTIKLSDYGITDQPTIKPYIPSKRSNVKSKQLAVLNKLTTPFTITTENNKHKTQHTIDTAVAEATASIIESRHEEIELLTKQRERESTKRRLVHTYIEAADQRKQKIVDLPDMTYISIYAVKPIKTRYGDSYVLIGIIGDNKDATNTKLHSFWADKYNRDNLEIVIRNSKNVLGTTPGGVVHFNGYVITKMLKKSTKYFKGNAYPELLRRFNELLDQPPVEDDLTRQIREAQSKRQMDVVDPDAIRASKDLKRFKSLTVGDTYKIIGLGQQSYRGKQRYILTLEGHVGVFVCNYWMNLELIKIKDKSKHITFVLDVLRTTKQKNKEHKVKIVK